MTMHTFKAVTDKDSNQHIINLCVDLKDISVDEVISKLDSALKNQNLIDEEMIGRVSYVADGHKLSIAFILPIKPIHYGTHEETFTTL